MKEAANKLEDFYQSQIVPVYDNLMKISFKINVVEIRNEMMRGYKIMHFTIWTPIDAVNNKKALLYDGSRLWR